MALYGFDFYGTEYYGRAPFLQFNANPVLADAVGYGNLRVSWAPPSGDWDRLRVVRNSYGAPDFASDGTILVDVLDPNFNETLDTGLREGNFYYYSVFVRATLNQRWVRAGSATGLVTEDHGYAGMLFRGIPGWFQEQDDNRPSAPSFEGPLRRFLRVIGLAADFSRTEMETLRWLRDPERVSGNLLGLLSQQYGVPLEPAIGMRRARFWLRDATFLYQRKGCLPGIRAFVTTLTGWDCEISYGPNLLRGLDSAAWFPGADTTIVDVLEDSDLETGDIVTSITTSGIGWEISSVPIPVADLRYHGIPISALLAYALSGEFLAQGTAGEVTVEMEWFDADGTSLGVETSPVVAVPNDGEWVRADLPSFSVAESAFVALRFRGDSAMKFRHAQLVQGSLQDWTPPVLLDIELLPTRTNYVTNPSFERGVATWSMPSGSFTVSTQQPLYGDVSLYIEESGTVLGTSGGDSESVSTTTIDAGDAETEHPDLLSGGPAEGPELTTGPGLSSMLFGGPYFIEFPEVQHAALIHVTNSDSRARIRWVNSAQQPVLYSSWAYATDALEQDWRHIRLSSFPPEDAVAAYLEIEVSEGNYVDGVMLETADTPGDYFDGSTFGADYIWGGDEHRSASRFYPQRATRNNRLLALLPDYLPVNQPYSLRYVEAFSEAPGLPTTPGTLGTDTLGLGTLGKDS